jgi:hypothetical protein
MNGFLPLPPPTREHQPHHCGYDSYDDYGYDYFTHRLIMHHSFDTRTIPEDGKRKTEHIGNDAKLEQWKQRNGIE